MGVATVEKVATPLLVLGRSIWVHEDRLNIVEGFCDTDLQLGDFFVCPATLAGYSNHSLHKVPGSFTMLMHLIMEVGHDTVYSLSVDLYASVTLGVVHRCSGTVGWTSFCLLLHNEAVERTDRTLERLKSFLAR